jgi:hypothetical protein
VFGPAADHARTVDNDVEVAERSDAGLDRGAVAHVEAFEADAWRGDCAARSLDLGRRGPRGGDRAALGRERARNAQPDAARAAGHQQAARPAAGVGRAAHAGSAARTCAVRGMGATAP